MLNSLHRKPQYFILIAEPSEANNYIIWGSESQPVFVYHFYVLVFIILLLLKVHAQNSILGTSMGAVFELVVNEESENLDKSITLVYQEGLLQLPG